MNILMKYFRHQKYSSFQRQLNLYGFRKVNKGPDAGAYAHKYFLRNRNELLSKVRRMPQASTSGGTVPSSAGGSRCSLKGDEWIWSSSW